MSDKVFELCAKELMVSEGGYTNDPDDRGNWTSGKVGVGELKGTKYGISAMAYPKEDIKNMTKERAMFLFRRDYWTPTKCDLIPDALSIMVSDTAYNSGCARACKLLQKCVKAKEDGVIGPKTLAAIKSAKTLDILDAYKVNRIEFLKGISTWPKYGKGWTNRVNKIYNMARKYL